MAKLKQFFKKNNGIISFFLLAAGFLVYILRSIHYAQTIPSTVWDEGMYMYKGYLFTSGKFPPFEDFGVWTNQMPLAYFVAGLPQVLFGPGLRAGRVFAVVIGTASLFGLGLGARRLRGNWWAAAMVWAVSLNQGWVMAFSQVFSQSMVSFFLAWMIFFLSGKRESVWEIGLAGLFASLAGMVRINVLPVLVLLVVYVIWRYGWKSGMVAAAAGLLPIVVIHAVYWPNILKLWAYWIPEKLFPAIAEYRSPWREVFLPENFSWLRVADWWGDQDHLAWVGIKTFVDGLRANFISWYGIVVVLILWPRSGKWKTDHDRKLAVFYTGTYLIMFLVHTWVSMGGKTCQFSCFPGYFLFFNWFGLMAVVTTAGSWKKRVNYITQIVLIVLLLAIVYLFFVQLGDNFRAARSFILIDLLGVSLEALMKKPGAELGSFWQFLESSLSFDSLRWLRFFWLSDLMTKVLWGLGAFVIVLVFPLLIRKLFFSKWPTQVNFGTLVMVSLLAGGVIAGSTGLLAQPMRVTVCAENVIERQELVGEKLSEIIPDGAQVFWDVKSSVPLLYLDDVNLFLPQLNDRFTYIPQSQQTVGQNQTKARFGWWDYQIGLEWIEETDIIVAQNMVYDHLWDWKNKVEQGEFDIILVTEPYDTCTGTRSELIVLKPSP
ncbi:MAG: hypothetical protein JW757_08090 [Anaerolineales bacterium]|nr:hypothetical protein [Anaerolineales bacterium]